MKFKHNTNWKIKKFKLNRNYKIKKFKIKHKFGDVEVFAEQNFRR